MFDQGAAQDDRHRDSSVADTPRRGRIGENGGMARRRQG
jgi:hypothetical protein